MEETIRKEIPEVSPFWKRLVVWSLTVLLLGVLIYLSVTFTRYALAPSRFPFWMRLPLFMAPVLFVLLAVWLVFRFVQLRAKEAAKRAGRQYKMGPRVAFWASADEWAFPALGSLFIFGLAFSCFALTFMVRTRPDFVWFRHFLLASGASFLAMSMIWPFRAIRRKLKSGSFLPSQEAIKVARGQMPLWKRKAAAGLWSFLAILQTYLAIASDHDRGTSWVLAVLIWGLAAWSTWEIFYPLAPKSPSTSVDSLKRISEDS